MPMTSTISCDAGICRASAYLKFGKPPAGWFLLIRYQTAPPGYEEWAACSPSCLERLAGDLDEKP